MLPHYTCWTFWHAYLILSRHASRGAGAFPYKLCSTTRYIPHRYFHASLRRVSSWQPRAFTHVQFPSGPPKWKSPSKSLISGATNSIQNSRCKAISCKRSCNLCWQRCWQFCDIFVCAQWDITTLVFYISSCSCYYRHICVYIIVNYIYQIKKKIK